MFDKKGMVLYLVLVSILVALVLASAILNLLLSQARFSHHEESRVQAYYAAMAGANYAFDRLRTGNQPACWYTPAASSTYTHCIYKTGGSCSVSDPNDATCRYIDDTLPHSISSVAITVCGTPPTPCDKSTYPVPACCDTAPSGTLKIISKATYTYTSP